MKCLALSVMLAVLSTSAWADAVLDNFGSGTPVSSWAYSRAIGVGKGNSTTYIPTLVDAAGAVFEGYVFNPVNGWPNVGGYDEDTIRVFETYAWSSTDLLVPVEVGLDDGHSLYVDGSYVTGGPFGGYQGTTLMFTAGVARRISVLGYNGPGPSNTVFRRIDNRLPLVTTPGLHVNATGLPIPEPSTLLLFALGAAGIGWMRRRRSA